MASFHMSVKHGRKGQAAKHAAYISRHGRFEARSSDLVCLESGNLPDWAEGDAMNVFRSADRGERKNGTTYVEFEMALPSELKVEENLELIRAFVEKQAERKPYLFAIHSPTSSIAQVAQPHVHLMINERELDEFERTPEQHFRRYQPENPGHGGCKKASGGKHPLALKDELKESRRLWAELVNTGLADAGHDARVDHRSYKERGIDRKPEPHLGAFRSSRLTDAERTAMSAARV